MIITQPTQSSFSLSTLTGDAEGNGINPYPAKAYYSDEEVVVLEENGNKFYRLTNRNRYSSTTTFFLNPLCFDQGVTYFASFNTRIHSEQDQAYDFKLVFERRDGSKSTRRILECPGHKFTDGWQTCFGEFIIDEELAQASNIKLLMSMLNTRDGSEFTVDTDKMQIRYHRGMVRKLVLENADVSCWGVGADIHVTLSIFYS